jgi:hypothetical protein
VFKLKWQRKIEFPKAVFGGKMLVSQEKLQIEQVRSLADDLTSFLA